MSTSDTLVPLLEAPWLNHVGETFPVTPLPGLGPEAIQGLKSTFPGILSAEMRSLLRASCGLAGAELGSIDFTSHWYSDEPLTVFRPCLTLAVDDEGRRWFAETSRRKGLPGPVWCVFSEPEVAMYVSDDLAGFLSKLHDCACSGRTLRWLRRLSAEAQSVWDFRETLALRFHDSSRTDQTIRGWLREMPFDAWVYDLRTPSPARGWPYGLAGSGGRLERCGQLSVFAVVGCSSQGRWTRHMSEIAATQTLPQPAVVRHESSRSGTHGSEHR
jgi:hypothetical protein